MKTRKSNANRHVCKRKKWTFIILVTEGAKIPETRQPFTHLTKMRMILFCSPWRDIKSSMYQVYLENYCLCVQ
ncbi:hypothetical protein EJ08DRAFT_294467 [Tothia fuscella]|uniref:Uncharacterized protein n=1 Tax=Tothia fuscella TaxID=1048955 RepID=A0A9P4P1X8_9PEZI|nr:hypothetical protein EJ08DRAFT_294467 [Tothia fuscella]